MQLERGRCNGVCCKTVQLESGALQSGLQLEKGVGGLRGVLQSGVQLERGHWKGRGGALQSGVEL